MPIHSADVETLAARVQEERPHWIAIAFANKIFASTETGAPETQVRTRLAAGGRWIRTLGPPWEKNANMRSRAKIGKSRPGPPRRGEASADQFINCPADRQYCGI
jgi:hypothetical protein